MPPRFRAAQELNVVVRVECSSTAGSGTGPGNTRRIREEAAAQTGFIRSRSCAGSACRGRDKLAERLRAFLRSITLSWHSFPTNQARDAKSASARTTECRCKDEFQVGPD